MQQIKPTINYNDFQKLDIRVGTIEQAEEVEKSEKLIKLTVNFGELGTRTILTGMKMHYSPEEMQGMQTLFVVNLEPRKMMGMESQGMILAVGLDLKQKPNFILPQTQAENGDGVS